MHDEPEVAHSANRPGAAVTGQLDDIIAALDFLISGM